MVDVKGIRLLGLQVYANTADKNASCDVYVVYVLRYLSQLKKSGSEFSSDNEDVMTFASCVRSFFKPLFPRQTATSSTTK